jgi:pilus assembly protein FimV
MVTEPETAQPESRPAFSSESMDDDLDLSDLDDVDEVSTKLDLAKAYLDMGDADGTRSILDEVMTEGNDDQKKEADDLLRQLG